MVCRNWEKFRMNSNLTAMKKYLILLLLAGLGSSLFAQNKALEQVFQKFSDREGLYLRCYHQKHVSAFRKCG
jgi:hypothetical protein